jgi:hypothetical protein
MQAAPAATGTEGHRQIAVLMQKPIRVFEPAAKVQGRHQGDGQNLGVTDPALGIFTVPEGFSRSSHRQDTNIIRVPIGGLRSHGVVGGFHNASKLR